MNKKQQFLLKETKKQNKISNNKKNNIEEIKINLEQKL